MAYIPGYLLRRIYVKGSMKTTPQGLEFTLRNDLATATVTRLQVEVDGRPAKAAIQLGDKTVEADQVSPENPLRFPRGTQARIIVYGDYSPGTHKVKIRASVAGFGEGALEFEDEAK